MQTMMEPQLIQKEQIPRLNFKKNIQIEQDKKLKEKLYEAMRLGNTFRGKTRIIFQDDEGLKQVETTVWATGASYIALKGGVWLPINRIVDVQFI